MKPENEIDSIGKPNSKRSLFAEVGIVLFPLLATCLVPLLGFNTTSVRVFVLIGMLLTLALAILALRRRGCSLKSIGFCKPTKPVGFAVSVILGLVVMILVTGPLIALLVNGFGWSLDLSQFESIQGNVPVLIVGLLLVWTFAAFGEEFLWRGYLLNILRAAFSEQNENHFSFNEDNVESPDQKTRAWNTWAVPILFTAIATGIAHAYQGPTGMLVTGVLSLIFCVCYLGARRNLWSTVLLHGTYDTIGFVTVFLYGVPLDV